MAASERTSPQVLVVEDNQLVNGSLFVLLQAEGYQPVIFSAVQPALEFIRDHCPDIALIDIHLPDGSGLEVARELRQAHGEDLPIIIISADSSIDTLRELTNSGATFFMAKPANVSHLLQCMRQWTRGPTAQST